MTDDRGHNPSGGQEILTYADDSRRDYDETATYQLMIEALRELLIEKELITSDEVRKSIEFMDSRTPELGAGIIAKAWSDPEFKKRLLEDGSAGAAEMGIAKGDNELLVVENTPDTHNVIVCTLCSCYPRNILGLPPDWYKSKSYRSRVVSEPRNVLKEFGTEIPKDVAVQVHDSNADMRYLVLPMRPEGTEGWSEAELITLVNRDCMIGVSQPRNPDEIV